MSIREWARTLGWPEGRPTTPIDSFPSPPPPIVTGPISVLLGQRPKLRVGKGQLYRARRDGLWWWEVALPGGVIDRGTAPSWREALAVGLAALEAATMRARK